MPSLRDYLARRCIFAQLQDFVQKDLREVIRRAVNKKQVLVSYCTPYIPNWCIIYHIGASFSILLHCLSSYCFRTSARWSSCPSVRCASSGLVAFLQSTTLQCKGKKILRVASTLRWKTLSFVCGQKDPKGGFNIEVQPLYQSKHLLDLFDHFRFRGETPAQAALSCTWWGSLYLSVFGLKRWWCCLLRWFLDDDVFGLVARWGPCWRALSVRRRQARIFVINLWCSSEGIIKIRFFAHFIGQSLKFVFRQKDEAGGRTNLYHWKIPQGLVLLGLPHRPYQESQGYYQEALKSFWKASSTQTRASRHKQQFGAFLFWLSSSSSRVLTVN